jgi:hypothetical protein
MWGMDHLIADELAPSPLRRMCVLSLNGGLRLGEGSSFAESLASKLPISSLVLQKPSPPHPLPLHRPWSVLSVRLRAFGVGRIPQG